MRKLGPAAFALATSALVGVFGALPAAAATAVLTVGSIGGPPAAIGDDLSASLAAGTTATFLTGSSTSSGIKCASSGFKAKVASNPAAPGTATATLNQFAFGNCTTNLPGFTGIDSITVNNLPYLMGLASSLDVKVSKGPSGPVQLTILITAGDPLITCIYQPAGGTVPAAFSNTDSSVTFSRVQFNQITTGPAACPGPLYFSARYAPLADVTQGGRRVFVN